MLDIDAEYRYSKIMSIDNFYAIPAWRYGEIRTATDADAALVRLKLDIMRGDFAPDERLRVRVLMRKYGIGASPMREALARLAGAGFVRLEGQKGFRVTPVGRADLLDITRSRQIVEPEAFVRAIEAADEMWEAELLKAFHLLRRELARRVDASKEWLDRFEARHHAFHRALIAPCPLRYLRDFCDDLYLRGERYRRTLMGYSFDTRDVAAEHENLMEAALSRNAKRARKELIAHIALTADLLELLPEERAAQEPDYVIE
jgi:GntR family transcriptional regulator, carbon starvation induced regulator